jgi:hypothetical protein
MTKSTLIKKLSMYPNDTVIVLRGYEGGYGRIESLESLKVVGYGYKKWFNSEFIESFDDEPEAKVVVYLK